MYSALLIVFAIITSSKQHVQDPSFWQNFDKYAAECIKEERVDVDVVFKAWDDNKFPDKPKIRCYFKCLSLKLGIMDGNGEIMDETFGKVVPELIEIDAVDEVVNKCQSVKEADACETGFKLMACIRNATID